MTRPKLVPQVESELLKWTPKNPPKVVGYGALSSITQGEDLLDSLSPDLLILDEAHELGNIQSARTRRVDRYLRSHQETRVIVMTGTLTKTSLLDHIHLLTWALPRSGFSDLTWPMVTAWDSVLSPTGEPDQAAQNTIAPLLRWAGTQNPTEAYHLLLKSTPGVILTPDSSTESRLSLHPWSPSTDPSISKALYDLKRWELPDGSSIVDATEYARTQSSLSIGFYYARPEAPPGVAEAREAWASVLKRYLRRPYNSEGLVAQAALSGDLGFTSQIAWEDWEKVRSQWPIGTPTWVSSSVIDEAISWGRSQGSPSIIWTTSAPALEAFRDRGIPSFGAGSAIPRADKDPLVAVSTRVHGTGSNLQAYTKALILEPPTSGASWEQLLGRQHRPGGQDVDVFIYTRPWNMRASLEQARYIKGLLGSEQKLLIFTGLSV
jgi:hypothetical protein